jgi:heme-degrading monooxygenase HmoA
MPDSNFRPAAAPIWKIDKFAVPEPELRAFEAILHDTHSNLETLDGFLWQGVFVQAGGPARFNVVTAVAWRDDAAMVAAKDKVRAWQAARDFDPQAYLAARGMEADMGLYRGIAALTSPLGA